MQMMEFHEKLQELRKQKGLTQEELAQALFVSRTAVSKWESGRGYPNLDSLKAIAKFFGITIDDLLSCEEVLTIAESDTQQKQNHLQDLIWGLLDLSAALFFFLPFFGQDVNGMIREVSLPALTVIRPWLLTAYYIAVIAMIGTGILTLALQNCTQTFWIHQKRRLSALWNIFSVFLFIITRQPYAATFTLVFLIIKMLLLIKKE